MLQLAMQINKFKRKHQAAINLGQQHLNEIISFLQKNQQRGRGIRTLNRGTQIEKQSNLESTEHNSKA